MMIIQLKTQITIIILNNNKFLKKIFSNKEILLNNFEIQ